MHQLNLNKWMESVYNFFLRYIDYYVYFPMANKEDIDFFTP